jgi:ATP-binding protein involved in chromosome partitioning
LMDTDVYGPSVRKMLPEDRMPSQKGEWISPALCEGIKMISMAYFRKEGEAAVVRAPIANGIVTQFISNVQWGELDYLLIDFPPGTGDVQLTLSQKANLTGAVMVTTPQEVAMMDVRKAMNMFSLVKVPIVGVIENMSGYTHPGTDEKIYLFGKGGGERLAGERGVPFLGPIPIDPELSLRSDQGRSIFIQEEGVCPSAPAFLKIAKTVQSQVEAMDVLRKSCLNEFEIHWKEMPSDRM